MLQGLRVVVTNVTHFVGLPAALEMARQGARVICHDRAFADAAARTSFHKDHPGLDLAAETEPEATIDAAAQGGPIDVLVNNDFFPALRAPIDTAVVDDLRRTLEDLVVAPFRFAGAAARHMKPRRAGKILFVTSAAPLRGLPNYAMYVTGRGAANALALSLAQELAAFNIQVNAVAPNYVESPSYFPPDLIKNPDAMKRFTEKVPLKRLGTPSEVAATIAFFASPGSNFITGHVLPVAGGWA
jgi:NAD(P)-dependent dehydrogenase (short-subunit alcohol dehydrogenase family)